MGRHAELCIKVSERLGEVSVIASGEFGATDVVVAAAQLDRTLLRAARHATAGRVTDRERLDIGARLGSLLFPGAVRDRLAEALAAVVDGDLLRIRVDADPWVEAVPWELAYVPSLGTDVRLGPFLALDERVTFVRHATDSPVWNGNSDPHADRLIRVKIAPATKVPGRRRLQGSESVIIESVLTDEAGFHCDVLTDPVSDATIAESLDEGCDVFHFVGHGDGGRGLIVASPDGQSEGVVSVDRVGDLLRRASTRLAVLNACDTAAVSSSVERAALKSIGVAAIIAMQHEIEDSHALVFTRTFYESFRNGEGIELAVVRGRQAMCLQGILSQWAVPVLFLGAVVPFTDREIHRPKVAPIVVAAESRVRFNVPNVVPGFTGRQAELAALGAASDSPPNRLRCHFLSGVGGVGKTQLAAAYLSARLDVFDIVAWIRAENGATTDLVSLGRALGLEADGRTPDELASDVWAYFAATTRTWLVVLDNVDDLALLHKVPATGNGELLVTSRIRGGRETLGVETAVSLFDPQTAVAFLLVRSGRVGEEADALRVAEALGHLPLALAYAGSYCDEFTGITFAEYLVYLDELRADRLFDTNEAFYERTVATTWAVSIAQATQRAPAASDLLDMASFLAADEMERSFFISGEDEPPRRKEMTDGLQALHRLSLLDVGPEHVRIHRLLQKVVRDDLDPSRARIAFNRALHAVSRQRPGDPRDPAHWLAWSTLSSHVLALGSIAHMDGVDGALLSEMLISVVELYIASGSPQHATAAGELAVKVASKAVGIQSREVIVARCRRAEALELAGDYFQAVLEGEALVAEAEAVLPITAREVLDVRAGLVSAYEGMRRSADAITEGAPLVDDCRASLGPFDPLTRRAARGLASSLLSVGRAGDAIEILDSLAETRTSGETGRPSLDHFVTTTLLAGCYRAAGRIRPAIDLGEGLVSDCTIALGSSHVQTATAQFELASTYRSAGRIEDAIALEERVIDLRTRLLGPRHSDTLWAKGNLGISYQSVGRTDEAIAVARQVLAAREEIDGPDHSATLTAIANLAISLRAAGRIDEAIAWQEELVAARTRVIGREHFSTLSARDHLGVSYRRAGRAFEAVATAEAVTADRTRILGANHPATLVSLDNLAAAYRSAGRLDDAIDAGRRALAGETEVLGEDHPETLWAKRNLAESLTIAGLLNEANDLIREALEQGRRVLGDQHPYVEWIASLRTDSTPLVPEETGKDPTNRVMECERVLWE